MKTLDRVIVVKLSQPQHTHEGYQLADIYYRTDALDVFTHGKETFGYPHNGGEHSLTIKAAAKDILAFLDMLDNDYDTGFFHEFTTCARKRVADQLNKED